MKIYLADPRNPGDTYPDPAEWTVVRGYWEFMALLADQGDDFTVVSFDHDLGETATGKLLETGYDAIKDWVDLMCPDPTLVEVRVHSANPVGAENIRAYWRSWCKHWARES